ncbi:SHPS1 phosphatase, partial [Polypterus senegalus]
MEAEESSNVTLVCVMSSETPLGPARWYKCAGSERTHFYSGAPKGGDKIDPRVTWTVNNTLLNYSITIRDLRINDTGEYYCEKYTKGENENKPYASGPGVKLTVKGFPVIHGPTSRVQVGATVNLSCEAAGSSATEIEWKKNDSKLTSNTESSLVSLVVNKSDIKSVIECQVSGFPKLSTTYSMNSIIMVFPEMTISGEPSLVLGQSATFNCSVSGFYPSAFNVSWVINNNSMMHEGANVKENDDGTFTESKTITLTATEEYHHRQLICQASHEGFEKVQKSVILSVRVHPNVTIHENPKLILGQVANFTCWIREFYPRNISLLWSNGSTSMESSDEVMENEDGTFTARSCITFNVREEHRGNQLKCQATFQGSESVESTVTLGVRGYNVSQPQGRVEALERSNVTLVCVLSSETPLGPVRWYKGAGSERTHFYSALPKGGDKNDPRVNWTMENPTVNYSITIRDLRVSDTEEYYCEKYTKADENKPNAPPYATGPGVTLTVRVLPGVPVIENPKLVLGDLVNMTCKLSLVYPKDIKVTWTWDKTFESSQSPHAEEHEDGTFTVTSVLSFTVKEDMRGTRLTCQAGYEGLTPVSGAVTLGVRGPPSIKGPQNRVDTGQTVSFTCESLGDQDTSITWLKGETTVSGGQKMSWSNGTRSELKMTLYKNDVKSRIYCQILGYRGGSVPSDALNFSTFILVKPEVTIQKTSAEDSHNSSSFYCKISGFYPDDIKVIWLLEGQTLNATLFNRSENLDGTFTAFTLIDVNVTNEVKQLNCVVTHMGNHNVSHSVEFAKRSSGDVSDGSSGSDVNQPQSSVAAVEGGDVTLTCILSSELPLGPIKWYKEVGSERTHFYSAVPHRDEKNDPRVAWTMDKVTVDFSITIRNIRFSDMGEYYCVKYREGEEDQPYASGPGVTLTVRGA